MNTAAQVKLLPACFFVVKVPDIDTIGAFTSCSGLELQFEVLTYSEGGNNEFVHQLPGRLQYPNLVLTRGLTNQDNLHKWLWKTRTEPELKEVTLTYQDHKKTMQRTWVFVDAFPVRWHGPHFEAGSSAIATESLEIAHSGLKGL